jgi:hypothetical protein
MRPRVFLILGRSLWQRTDGGWRSEMPAAPVGAAQPALTRLGEILRGAGDGPVTLVYEPEALVHVQVETPRVGRRVFAALARIREEHPAVASDHIGWGIEPPWLAPTGAYATLLHAEIAPSLIALRELCAERGIRLRAAWSAFTVAAALAGGDAPGRVPAVLLLTPGFVGVARLGGGRAGFKGWAGPLSDRDWAEVRGLLADAGVLSAGVAVSHRRRGGLAVVAVGDPAAQGPFWTEVAASGCVETVLGLDDLSRAAAALRPSHPANLTEAFPRPLELNRGLAAAAALALGTAGLLGFLAWREDRARLRASGEAAAELVALHRRLDQLGANERELNRLRESGEGEVAGWPRHRLQALTALAATVPDAVTLTAFRLDASGGFSLDALVLDPGFAIDEFQAALERAGFALAAGKHLTREAATGRLTANGRYEPDRS